jgi:hypothetical protein
MNRQILLYVAMYLRRLIPLSQVGQYVV